MVGHPYRDLRLPFLRGDRLHPGKQLVQIVITAMSHAPGQGVIHVFAVCLQVEREQLGDGQRGVAVVFAGADAVVLRAALFDEIHGVHDTDDFASSNYKNTTAAAHKETIHKL